MFMQGKFKPLVFPSEASTNAECYLIWCFELPVYSKDCNDRDKRDEIGHVHQRTT
jgi:hypothetical protein